MVHDVWWSAELMLVLLTSWPAVATVIALPAVLMLANFCCGQCGIADALDADRPVSAARSSHFYRSPRVLGRAGVAFVAFAFVWQLLSVNAIYATHGMILSHEFRTAHIILSVLFAILYVRAVTARPSISGNDRGRNTSQCSKCGPVCDMDHHCYWLHNCVGRHNRAAFVALTGIGSLLAALCVLIGAQPVAAYYAPTLVSTAGCTVAECWGIGIDWNRCLKNIDDMFHDVAVPLSFCSGLATAMAAFLGLSWLFLRQLHLLWHGETTLLRMKRHRARGNASPPPVLYSRDVPSRCVSLTGKCYVTCVCVWCLSDRVNPSCKNPHRMKQSSRWLGSRIHPAESARPPPLHAQIPWRLHEMLPGALLDRRLMPSRYQAFRTRILILPLAV